MGKELAKKIGLFLVGTIVAHGIGKVIDNLTDGKTWCGKKKQIEPKDETYIDVRGNIILGPHDGSVV